MAPISSQTGQTVEPRSRGRCSRSRGSARAARRAPDRRAACAANTFPWLKNQSETENESIISRSRFRTESGRRQSTRPSRKTAQKPEPDRVRVDLRAAERAGAAAGHSPGDLRPVQAGSRRPSASSTVPVAISPGLAREHVDRPDAFRVARLDGRMRRVALEPGRDLPGRARKIRSAPSPVGLAFWARRRGRQG